MTLFENNNSSLDSLSSGNEDDEENMVVNRIQETIKEQIRAELHDELKVIETKTSYSHIDGKPENETEDLEKLSPKLKRAILKMRRLDKILAGKEQREREVKRQRFLFHRQICKDLRDDKSCTRRPTLEEQTNMEKYLALEPPPSHNEGVFIDELPVTPLFDTQPNEYNLEENDHRTDSNATAMYKGSKSKDERLQNTASSMETASIQSESSIGINSHVSGSHSSKTSNAGGTKNFISRNIQLAADADSALAMTDDEKARIKLLLADINDLSEEQLLLEPEENAYAVAVCAAGEGYQPEVTERQDLNRIDVRLRELLPTEDYNALCCSAHSQADKPIPLFSRSGLITNTNDTLGDATLQEVHDDRSLQQKLTHVQDQLYDFYQNTPREIDSSLLTPDQLNNLLDECTRSLQSLIPLEDNMPQNTTQIENNSHQQRNTRQNKKKKTKRPKSKNEAATQNTTSLEFNSGAECEGETVPDGEVMLAFNSANDDNTTVQKDQTVYEDDGTRAASDLSDTETLQGDNYLQVDNPNRDTRSSLETTSSPPTERSNVNRSRRALLDNPPKLPDDVLQALLAEARMETDRVNRIMSEQNSESPKWRVPGIEDTAAASPYVIYRDVDENSNDMDTSREPFLPEIQSNRALVKNSNVQCFSGRSHISLQSIDSDDLNT